MAPKEQTESARDVFAARLKSTRTLRGLTQNQLAEKIGVSGETISRWEIKDEGPNSRQPQLAELAKLAPALGVSLDWLLGLPEAQQPEPAELSPRAQRVLQKAVKRLKALSGVVDDLSSLAPAPAPGLPPKGEA